LYEEALQNRLLVEKQATDSINSNNKQLLEKMNAARIENDRINALIIERNKNLREQWQQNADKMREKYIKDFSLNGEIMRSFAINNFGVWNCDHPQYPNYEIPILASYTDSTNVPVNLGNIAVVYKGFNGITQFAAGAIRVIPDQENMLWSIMDGSFYYFSYTDFKSAGITRGQQSFVFRMRTAGQQISSYEEIRKLVEKL